MMNNDSGILSVALGICGVLAFVFLKKGIDARHISIL
jgi:hypothetical protein